MYLCGDGSEKVTLIRKMMHYGPGVDLESFKDQIMDIGSRSCREMTVVSGVSADTDRDHCKGSIKIDAIYRN